MKPIRPASRLEFRIAIFCTLTIETNAVKALFDEHWNDEFGKAPDDPNTYITGSISHHNVVLYQVSSVGKDAVALAAKNCQTSFPNIKLALVVGLCGAVPFISNTNHEITLGDVIISQGTVVYDRSPILIKRFQGTNLLPDSSDEYVRDIWELLEKLNDKRGRSTLSKRTINHLAELQKVSDLQAQYPGVDNDKLFDATYAHLKGGETCEECGCDGQLISRTRLKRQEIQPTIHFGLIASGNMVTESGQERDYFAKDHNIMGFATESILVCDIFPSILIKGVCDYADNHMTNKWQRYAASTAAACTKALLNFSDATKFLVPYLANPLFIGRKGILQQLKNTLDPTLWRTRRSDSRVSLYGLGGIGKTQIALAYVYWLKEVNPTVSILWVHAGSAESFHQSYISIAEAYQMPGYTDPQTDVLSLVKTWLERKDTEPWLMVIDNADDIQLFFDSPSGASLSSELNKASKLSNYLPEHRYGSLLVTTRDQQLAVRLAEGQNTIEIAGMSISESEELLRTNLDGISETSADLLLLSSRLKFLPLALNQAAAFIRKASVSSSKYLQLLEDNHQTTAELSSKDSKTFRHESPTTQAIVKTWILSFKLLEKKNALASKILLFIGLFDYRNIQEHFVVRYAQQTRTEESISDTKLAQSFRVLEDFSFIIQNKHGGYDMHHLSQEMLHKWLINSGKIGRFWREGMMLVSSLYASGSYRTRTTCTEYLPHAYAILNLGAFVPSDQLEAKASLLDCIATYLNSEGRLGDAESLGLEAIHIRKQIFGEYHPSTLTSMDTLASILYTQGRWDEAETLQVIIIEKRKEMLGADHPDTLRSMGNLATIYTNQGQYVKAEQLAEQLVEILKVQLGADHPETLDSMTTLAAIYSDQARWADAEKLERQVMEISKAKLGAYHLSTLKSLYNLASSCERLGRWKEAETFNTQAMEGFRIKLGVDHPDTLSSMSNLAAVYRHQGRLEDAKELLWHATESLELKFGSDHPDTLTGLANLATIYNDQGLWAEAEPLLVRVSETLKLLFGEKHPGTLGALGNLASTFRQQGRLEEAEKLLVRVTQIKKEVLGEKHPETLSSTVELALALEANGRYGEAINYLQDALKFQEQYLGQQHTDTVNTRSAIARVVQAIGRSHHHWTEKSSSTTSEPLDKLWSIGDSSSGPTEQSIENPSADFAKNKEFFPMTFFNYKLLETGLSRPLDDVESILSIEEDIHSMDGSSSNTALAAVSYIAKMFVDNSELFGLYHEATKRCGETKFIRSHRRLLKRLYLDLLPESRTPQQHVAINFLRSRSARIRISQSIYRILKPLDGADREKINAILEQKTDDMFLLERHLSGISQAEQGAQVSTLDDTVLDAEGTADGTHASSESSDTSSLDIDDQDNDSFHTLKSIGDFLTMGEPFNMYKRNVRDFLYSPPKVQRDDRSLPNDMAFSASSRLQPSLKEFEPQNSQTKATGSTHRANNVMSKTLYDILETEPENNSKDIRSEPVNLGFLKLLQMWLRPSPCPGRQRITWKSARGKLLFLDIEGASKQEARRIQDTFRRTAITDQQSDISSAPPNDSFPTIPAMAYCPSNTHVGHQLTSFTDPDLGTSLDILGQNPEPCTQMTRPCYLLLCVTTRHNTYYQSINITRVLHDQILFQAIRDEYFNLKAKEDQDLWHKSGFLSYFVTGLQSCLKSTQFFTPRSVELVSFFLMPVPKGTEQNFWPFGLQLSYPPEDEVKAQRWDYQPCPKRFTNLHMSKAFVTTMLEPGHAHHDDAWLHLFPKKLGSSLRYERGGTNLGWGVHIIEGLNYRQVAWAALLLVVVSGIFGILYSAISGDAGAAFTVAAWVVGAAVLAISSVELSIK